MTQHKWPIVEVIWDDAYSNETGWFSLADLPENLLNEVSYASGYLIRRNKREVVLATNYSGTKKETFADIMVIPASLVRSIRIQRYSRRTK